MKKFIWTALSLMLCLTLFPIMASAEAIPLDDMPTEIPYERLLPRLVDNADLLTESEESELLAELDEISERQELDVVIITLDDIPYGYGVMEYADDLYDYYGFGFGEDRDGILLMLSMSERDWWISTCGYGITVFTDAGQEYMVDSFMSYISDGYYADGFSTFAQLCDDFITQAYYGEPYDIDNLYDTLSSEDLLSPSWIILVILAGFILSFIPVSIMKSQLKTVRMQHGAGDYVKKDSLNITSSSDIFLYHTVAKTVRESESSGGSSTHTSSSGSSHGGSGGKF